MSLVSNIKNVNIEKEDELYKKISAAINGYENITPQILAVTISALCGISVADLMTEKRNHHVMARWLLYYTYHYITSTTYKKMCEIFTYDGSRPTYSSIRNGILSFSYVIETNKYWGEKWRIMHSIIKECYNMPIQTKKQEIIITMPKELKDKVTIKIE